MNSFRIAVLAGDGIGPEVVEAALPVLRAAAEAEGARLDLQPALVGGAAYDATGHPLPPETLRLCHEADAVLLGAVGGPMWDAVQPPELRPELGALLPLRRELGLFANLRPARLFPPLASASSLRPDLTRGGLDILVVRELTGGIYFGEPRGRSAAGDRAVDTAVYTRGEIERILHTGFQSARARSRRLCSVDKANVLETSRLWRETCTALASEYPDVQLSHMLVDNCAMQLVRDPAQFDVIVTDNLFGDILSDEAAMLTGSLGMLPSASLGAAKEGEGCRFGLFEPVHGSAPSIAGQDIANPLATILSCALLLRYALGLERAGAAVERAVERTLDEGLRTADIAQEGAKTSGTRTMASAVVANLRVETEKLR